MKVSENFADVVRADGPMLDTDADLAAARASRDVGSELTKKFKPYMDGLIEVINDAFQKYIGAEWQSGPGGRLVEGRDGVMRKWDKVYGCFDLGSPNDPRWPDADVVASLGRSLARLVVGRYPDATAFAYLAGRPVTILGDAFDGVAIRIATSEEFGDQCELRVGCYYAPIEFKETK